MPPGRPRTNKKELRCYISERLFNELQLVLMDRLRGKMTYGAVSNLAESLFSDWLEKVKSGEEAITQRTKG